MFTLKFFAHDGSYTAHACASYTVTRIDGKRYVDIDGGMRKPIDQKLIVENSDGKTIDLLRGGRHGLV